MKYTKIPSDTFQNIQMNAGVLLKNFDPATAEVSLADIIGATTGGNSFTATPTYTDFGDDIDNCPKNTKQLKKLESWEAKVSGTFVTLTPALAQMLVASGDIDDSADGYAKITARDTLTDDDFKDLWLVGDYSDENSEEDGGFVAIHLLNALNTAGFSFKSSDKAKGQFSFEFTGHYDIEDQTKIPFEIYVSK